MTPVLILELVGLFATTLVGGVLIRRRRFRRLRWPPNMGYVKFCRYCSCYFRYQGWTVIQSGMSQIDLFIRKDAQQLAIVCRPWRCSSSMIADAAAISRYRPEPVVIVTASPVDVGASSSAGSVTVLHYRQLGELIPTARRSGDLFAA